MTNRRQFIALAASGVASSLAGCGYRPGAGDIRWSANETIGTGRTDAVALVEDRLIAVTDDSPSYDFDTGEWGETGSLSVFSTESKDERWQDGVPGAVRSRAIGTPVTLTTENAIYGYHLDEERWQYDLDTAPLAAGAASGRTYVLTDAGELLSIRRGGERWRRAVPVADRTAEAVVADDRGVVCLSDGVVRRYDGGGTEQWTRSAEQPIRDLRLVDDSLFALTRSRTVVFDAKTGDRRWNATVRAESIDVTETGVYVIADGSAFAFDRSGTRRFRVDDAPGEREDDWDEFVGIAADATGAYATTRDSVAGLDPGTGAIRWTVTHESVTHGPFLADSGVIVLVDDQPVCHYPTGT